ncbi:RiPP maturation radical SAM C-methyltransferase [Sorangium sp. So ce1182]|uniref:RiPP maturation radical SAM C-methyltransferase n=1 Tax=Sorangium sp. So ce1182 TaxID=3133334 RepID=UPI003F61C71A
MLERREAPAAGGRGVCLVSMPYPVLHAPSVALGLLSAGLRKAGLPVTTLYPCLWFAEDVGLDVYTAIADSKQEFLIGEWTFAGAAFPGADPDLDGYLDRVLSAAVSRGLLRKSRYGADPRAALLKAREAATPFVERVAARVLELRPAIVGCTSTFAQHCASLALLRRVREMAPEVVTVLGGANCEGDMGVATKRCFPWVDLVVSGEADLLFPALCGRLLDQGREALGRGLPHGAIGGEPARSLVSPEAPRAVVDVMDETPVPDFDDYIAALRASPLERFISPALSLETSRGCWWGKKHHCTFCGLNGGSMAFRSKSADRVVSELAHLSSRYNIRKFNVVDNILDLSYIESVLPRVSERPYNLFFETKVNLKRPQIERLAAAGVRRLQPGIESMHDEVLRLIDKGTTALQNVQFLRWSREIGVFVTWNFLWDIPGERDAWYGEMADWLPWVVHLQPPGVDRIQFHRFSPYHQRSGDFGLSLEPFPSYRDIYPTVPLGDLGKLAYYFHDTGRRPAKEELEARPHLKRLLRTLAAWNMAWGQGGFRKTREAPVLRMDDEGDRVVLVDTRPCAAASEHVLEGLACRVYRACDAIQTFEGLLHGLGSGGQPRPPEEDVRAVLEDLEARRVLLRLNGKLLGLALRAVSRIPDAREEFPGGHLDIEAYAEAMAAEPHEGNAAA